MMNHADILKQYAQEVSALYRTGVTTEHSFRGSLQTLLNAILPQYNAVNEPQRSACGAPDYALVGKKDRQPHAYIEAKDLFDNDLRGVNAKGHKAQFDRYKQALPRIAFTDYLTFVFYVDGAETASINLLTLNAKGTFQVADGERFISMLTDWANCNIQPITTASRLAEIMAYKARLLNEAILKTLQGEAISNRLQQGEAIFNRLEQGSLRNHSVLASLREINTPDDEIHSQYEAFKRILLSDLTEETFADLYAQTIVYGMFAARLNDPTPEDFSRQEAATLIPVSNPFLCKIFQHIAGYDLDSRIAWIVDDLAEAFAVTDMQRIMGRYQQNALHQDPLMHFYEDFLAAYNPALRKACGVYYTPQPVVGFIVRAIDSILQRDFGFPDGLAEDNKRLQILDPATGTGTFLAETVRLIHGRFEGNEGLWSQFVEESLRPRLHGFELLMAPYTITHLKLDMLLQGEAIFNRLQQGEAISNRLEQDTLRNHSVFASLREKNSRLHVYLTNSLEECHPDTGTLFAQWLSNEATAANTIKRDCPVMVMMGNPPYSVSSNNKGEWISRLVEDYKRGLNEKNIQPLSDDYIKFIRLAQYYIERNGSGVMGFITNNSYLDGLIHRRMRESLLQCFDAIYIVNLHGNSKRKETSPDGRKDENVFDIMVGTSIFIGVKQGEAISNRLNQGKAIFNRLNQGEAISNRLNQGEAICNRLRNNARKQAVENRFSLHYIDLYGTRKAKYATLDALDLPCSQTAAREPSDSRQSYWQILTPTAPNYFFVPKDFTLQEEYEKGIKLDELFKENNIGIITGNDKKLIGYTIEQLQQSAAEVDSEFNEQYIKPINYRPFDKRYIYYRTDLIERARAKIMQHMLQENVGLVLCRQLSGDLFYHTFVSDSVIDNCVISNATKERCYLFPLYLYDSNGTRHLNMQGEAIFNRLPKDIKDIYEDSQAITNQAIENRFSLQNRSSLYLSQTLSVNETRANLPHWHQNGKLQFVTFRLADALPHEKWLQLQEQKIIFEKENPKPWNDEILHQYYKLFGSKIDEWLDANYGSCILKNPQVRKIVEDALLFFNEKRYILHSYVIMPNHVHVLFELLEENKTSEILQSWKRHTANQINKLLGTAGSLWQKESFDRLIRDGEHYKRVCRYIVNNPKGLSPDCYTLQGEAICNRLQSQGEAICNRFINNDEGNNGAITNRFSLDFFAYIYAILHSPSYRERYKEFLKIDFPRIPIPTDMAEYQRLVGLGKELIDLHLMQQAIANRFSLPNYPIAGSNVVEFVKFVPDEQAITNRFSLGRLYINSTQYFDHVPEVAYNLYIGGYQPAQKWLKDRKGRALTLNDIRHYQRLLSTLHRTAEIMQEIG